MTTLYFLDAAEFTDVSAVAAAQPGARVERVPGYVAVTSDGPLVVDRRATGVRHSVWYSALAAEPLGVRCRHGAGHGAGSTFRASLSYWTTCPWPTAASALYQTACRTPVARRSTTIGPSEVTAT